MLRKTLLYAGSLIVVAAIVAFGFGPGYLEKGINLVVEHEPYQVSDEARGLHASLIVADLHSDTFLWNRDVLERGNRGHVDVPRLVEGGVAVQVFSTVTKAPKELNYEENTADSDQITAAAILQRWPMRTWGSLYERARYQAQRLNKAATRSEGELVFIRTQGDLYSVLDARQGQYCHRWFDGIRGQSRTGWLAGQHTKPVR